jgi:hypothetical protein
MDVIQTIVKGNINMTSVNYLFEGGKEMARVEDAKCVTAVITKGSFKLQELMFYFRGLETDAKP